MCGFQLNLLSVSTPRNLILDTFSISISFIMSFLSESVGRFPKIMNLFCLSSVLIYFDQPKPSSCSVPFLLYPRVVPGYHHSKVSLCHLRVELFLGFLALLQIYYNMSYYTHMLFMYSMNNLGPKIEPCGTPHETFNNSDFTSLICTY